MRRTVFLAAASWVCGLGVSAQQHNIDTQKSTLTIHVGKTGVFSGLGHEHEVRAPIHSGTADTGAHPAVEVHVNAQELRVVGKDEPEKNRAEVQKTILGPEVLDSERHQGAAGRRSGSRCGHQGSRHHPQFPEGTCESGRPGGPKDSDKKSSGGQ